MGLKDSINLVLSKLAGGSGKAEQTAAPDAYGLDIDEAALEKSFQDLEAKLGYSFTDRSLLRNALLHRSHVHVTGQDRERSNERLEFLGDAVLGLIVNEDLYQKYPDRSEGDLTKMKALLVCGARLSEVAGQVDLGVHIRMSRSEAATGGRNRSSILADTTEALIGAVYLDGGLEASRAVIQRVVLERSDQVLARRSLRNYKSRLQELIQAGHKSPPRYRVLEVDGPDHDRLFKVSVTFGGISLGMGEGRNKKTAEQNAAREALDTLEADPELLDRERGTP
jgi:ribonuclease-3